MLFTGIFNREMPKAGERYTAADAAQLYTDPMSHYTAEHQELTREKIARMTSPILIVQGDARSELNRFNATVLMPELRAAGKSVEVMTYPGEPHCFFFYSDPSSTPRPAVALKAFQDTDAFFREHISTQPKPIDAGLVEHVPVN